MVMVFADVTQRVCVQRALGESEARFRAIFESSPSPIVICRLTDGVLLGVSPQFERWSGYSREEAVGRSMADLGLAGAAAIDGILAVLRDAGPVDQALVQGRRKDGACVEYLFSAVALEWGGTPSAIVMTADVTEQRRAESALHASKMEIARQAGRAEVATDVLHNVGNVLNSVNMSATLVGDKLRKSEVGTLGLAAQMMLDHAGDLPGFLTTDQRGKRMPALLGELAQVLTADQATLLAELGNLSAAVEHLRRIVDIQQVSGSSRSVTEWANPCEIVDRAIHLSSAWLHRHGIQIQTRCGFDQPVLLDTHKLLQVVVNLLNNAKDALKQVPLDRRQLDVSVEEADGPEGKCLRIVVIDNGAGIAPEHLARLFTFGFTTRPHGHGYGLHSAALLAKDMRGSLTAFSRGIGCGAAFTLELPLVMQESSS
jgi:PAS domain S-box-containing protein